MTEDEIRQAVAKAHFDAYSAAIKVGKTPEQAMKIANTAADAKRRALNDDNSS